MRIGFLVSLLFGLSLVGCAHGPKPTHFTAPSVVPVTQSVDRTRGHITDAQKTVAELAKRLGDKDSMIVALNRSLDSAQTELRTAQNEIVKLDAQVKVQTIAANKLIDLNNKVEAQNVSLKASKHFWVKSTWYLGLALAAALIWIFKKPIFALIRMAAGIP